jgi:D-3-phosphoglycerate dehydrogenase
MTRILVLYDRWMLENAEEMWRTAFDEAMGDRVIEHEFVYAENVQGEFKWSTDMVDNVKEAYGNPEYIKEKISGCEYAVSGYAPFTADIMGASDPLKLVGIARGGPVNVDHEAATRRRVMVIRAVGRNAESVADQTMGFILSESRFIARHSKEIKTGEYFTRVETTGRSKYLGSLNWLELNGKTLGLIGYGQVGRRVAKRAHAFGMKVTVFDPYINESILEGDGCTGVSLNQLLTESDIVSIHAKLTPETHHMINDEALAKMKKTAILVNTSRGSIIDEAALYRALKKGTIGSAALDVFEVDPIKPDNPLIQLDNVTITPHTAGRSPVTEMRGYRQIAEQVARHLQGEEIDPVHISNKAVM